RGAVGKLPDRRLRGLVVLARPSSKRRTPGSWRGPANHRHGVPTARQAHNASHVERRDPADQAGAGAGLAFALVRVPRRPGIDEWSFLTLAADDCQAVTARRAASELCARR